MKTTNTLEIPQEVMDSGRLTLEELRVELAILLYASGRLSLGKARDLARMSLWEFRQTLGSRRVSPHYGEDDLDEDVATLRELGRP
jgi:predicted HTH domain antitoxin